MQTLYAILGVFLVSIFALNHRSARTHAERAMMRSEIEFRATALARDVFDELAELPYDANTSTSLLSSLTSASAFGSGSDSFEGASDLDDVHGKTLTRLLSTDSDTLAFALDAVVEYVTKQGDLYVGSGSQTYYKKVTLTVRGPLESRFSLERVFSYQNF